MDNTQPIIIKRVKRFSGGAHGGAWKIAFADFMTAMMAFFLVLWLLSSATPEQLKAIAGYFQDPVGFTTSASPYVIDMGGSPTPSPNRTLNPDVTDPGVGPSSGEDAKAATEKIERERLEMLQKELQDMINGDAKLAPDRKSVV